MNLFDLLKAVEAAYQDVQLKSKAREAAAMALAAAQKDQDAAAATLNDLREQISAMLGNVLPQADPRFRKSS